jgi:tetratricopeptide (TPR) repeat protein
MNFYTFLIFFRFFNFFKFSKHAQKCALGLLIISPVFITSCLSGGEASADEYFSMGMAYYEIGKYEEAERWLNRASSLDKTKEASEYNLGRIAFERGRYEDAAKRFESILTRDPQNIMALKGAAYSRIKNGDLAKAEELYNRVLALVPESADDGYNYALVLYAVKKYEESETVLLKYRYSLDENKDTLLLLARTQKALDKVEAVDTYDRWVANNTGDAVVLYEYAGTLEKAGFYARAIEQYRASLAALKADTETLKKSGLRFDTARVFLTADPDNAEGMTELNAAVEAGFADIAALEALSIDERITQSNRDSILKVINTLQRASTESSEPSGSEAEGEGGTETPQE